MAKEIRHVCHMASDYYVCPATCCRLFFASVKGITYDNVVG